MKARRLQIERVHNNKQNELIWIHTGENTQFKR